jgi:hypothetical protein
MVCPRDYVVTGTVNYPSITAACGISVPVPGMG